MKTFKTAPSVILTKPTMRKSPPATTIPSARPIRYDPILQELWGIKSAINKEANYDAATLLRTAQNVVNKMRLI